MQEQFNTNNNIQTLKSLLTQILHKNSAYDCMSINSAIQSIEKSVSLFDAVNILISNQLDQLLVWDSTKNKWIWMLTLVDAIRFILHAVRSLKRHGYINFSDFQNQPKQQDLQQLGKGGMGKDINKQQLNIILKQLQQKSIQHIITQLSKHPRSKNYIRLKSVQKQSKISLVILTMGVQKIHRILVQDSQSHMLIAVLNFKDIFLYILRMANDSPIQYYSSINIGSLLQQTGQYKNIQINYNMLLWQAFQIMTDKQKSMWINVVDQKGYFLGMLFRQDFRSIFQGWKIKQLWMTVGQFLNQKKMNSKGNVPQFRFFQPSQFTRDLVWKMVMTTRNTIVWVQDGKVQTTIGLMELFRLYVQ